MSYIENNINEGFDILSGRKLRFNPRHNNVLNTDLDVYADELNSSNVLIVDDSITNGFSAESTIKAISNLYTPESVSVLTMFSKLYDADGNEISRKEEIPVWLLDEAYVAKRRIYNKVMNEIAKVTKDVLNKIDID